MSRDELIGGIRDDGRARNRFINPQGPRNDTTQGAKGGLGPAVDVSIRLDQMNGLLQLIGRQVREAFGDFGGLIGKSIDLFAHGLLPTGDPAPAERALAVKNEERLFWWTSHSRGLVHEWVCSVNNGARSKRALGRAGPLGRPRPASEAGRNR